MLVTLVFFLFSFRFNGRKMVVKKPAGSRRSIHQAVAPKLEGLGPPPPRTITMQVRLVETLVCLNTICSKASPNTNSKFGYFHLLRTGKPFIGVLRTAQAFSWLKILRTRYRSGLILAVRSYHFVLYCPCSNGLFVVFVGAYPGFFTHLLQMCGRACSSSSLSL